MQSLKTRGRAASWADVRPRLVPLAKVPKPAPKRRLASIEAARVLSAVNVVVCHVCGVSVGGAFLLMALSTALTVRAEGRDVLFKDRAKRLVVPWAFWSAFYLAPRLIHAWRHGESAGALFSPDMLLVGGAGHLWYLPFAFVATVVSSYALGLVRSRLAWSLAAALALAAAGVAYGGLRDVFPAPQWMLGSTAALLGVAMRSMRPGRANAWKMAAIAGPLAAAALVAYRCGGAPVALPAAAGSAMLCVAWSIRTESPKWLSYCAGLGYGVYLLHPAALWFVRPLGFGVIPTTAAAVASAGLLTAALRHTTVCGFGLRTLV